MRAPESMPGLRVVAKTDALGALTWPEKAVVLRLAPDDMFVFGAVAGASQAGNGIVEEEHGFVGWWLTPDELEAVTHHVEWALPGERPALAQGLIAGVPARLWLGEDRTLLLCHRAYAHELIERIE